MTHRDKRIRALSPVYFVHVYETRTNQSLQKHYLMVKQSSSMDTHTKVVIIGAGIFGLTTAYQLALEGYKNIVVLDRHVPPTPDASSNDISRVIRFDYADGDYLDLAHEAYLEWSSSPRFKDCFSRAPIVVAGTSGANGALYLQAAAAQLTKRSLPWTKLRDANAARKAFPSLKGPLAKTPFIGYFNENCGWADASKTLVQLRDDCLSLGVSFICGPAGMVTSLDTDNGSRNIIAARTLAGDVVQGNFFILAAGAWSSSLVSMYNSVLATGQVLGYMRLTDAEMQAYRNIPIYLNLSTGWFNFPPHDDTKLLKFAIHGWGYTRSTDIPRGGVQADGETRLRDGLRETYPELADRPFERTAVCWYSDTPSGDFIMDYHPDYTNLFVGGAGSGHAFKFTPVLGKYMSLAIKKKLPPAMRDKWRFRTEHLGKGIDVFKGDGSRGGPARRELCQDERAELERGPRVKL
ncbi:sarcosine oxidase / L-pipecolate oxidase [Purpureocillium lavendulum]|uniref:Sarcosine oxidase / L-pipecolate oxidase n=1 Tax=Purpureocillium lavendulum TaxID=1247861 RepID=A0AB34FHC4_9HYPO|nr:sarcosine oxidase / L-pipecolate oxidase [Purpureocillium lavendulum]